MAFRYFAKFNDDDRPIGLFRVDPDANLEQLWAGGKKGWLPSEGILEDIVEGSFQYAAITEEAAQKNFPDAFNA